MCSSFRFATLPLWNNRTGTEGGYIYYSIWRIWRSAYSVSLQILLFRISLYIFVLFVPLFHNLQRIRREAGVVEPTLPPMRPKVFQTCETLPPRGVLQDCVDSPGFFRCEFFGLTVEQFTPDFHRTHPFPGYELQISNRSAVPKHSPLYQAPVFPIRGDGLLQKAPDHVLPRVRFSGELLELLCFLRCFPVQD